MPIEKILGWVVAFLYFVAAIIFFYDSTQQKDGGKSTCSNLGITFIALAVTYVLFSLN